MAEWIERQSQLEQYAKCRRFESGSEIGVESELFYSIFRLDQFASLFLHIHGYTAVVVKNKNRCAKTDCEGRKFESH